MADGKRNRSINEINRVSMIGADRYVTTDLGIRESNEETANIISATYGVLKNSLEALWYSVGLDPNVNVAYQKMMTDPDTRFEAMGRTFYPHPGVGNLKAYNEAGNPSGGCFSMQTLA